jgi:polysaccharide export outer membrane protein
MNCKIKLSSSVYIALCLLLLSSCLSNKKYVYLQNVTTHKVDSTSDFIKINKPNYHLQISDILTINIASEDESVSKIFNAAPSTMGNMNMVPGGVGGMMYYTGVGVNDSGNIVLPIVGNIYVLGKTLSEANAAIRLELNKYFKNYHLTVQFSEFRCSVIGEVTRPGKYSFLQNQVNILEVLAHVGDLTPLANRLKVSIIRQYPEGLKIHQVNLTDARLLESPYYFLKPNDVIYVEPIKMRELGNLTSAQNTLTTIATVASTFLLVLNTYIIFKSK